MQNSISGSSEKYRTKPSELSPFQTKKHDAGFLGDQNSCRQPMGDVGNIEVIIFPDHALIDNFQLHNSSNQYVYGTLFFLFTF